MKPIHRLFLAGLAGTLLAGPAFADQKFPAELAGHGIIDAATFVAPPADAPELFRTSGKFTATDRKRVDQPRSIEGTSFLSAPGAARGTGMALPFEGQPVQGFSGIKALGDGTFMVLTDNGFGSKGNSPDAMLTVHKLAIDWRTGKAAVAETLFLRDPDRKAPFPIVTEATKERYLTGADFDVESMQIIGDRMYFGDEFGPYILVTDLTGKLLAMHESVVDGKTVRSPDHYAVSTPAVPGAVGFEVRRSRGFEGMAASKDGAFLYPLFEGPLWTGGAWETKDGREYLRIAEFDVAKGAFTGRSFKYLLEANGNNIGDFNMIDATTGLIIERDNGEGDPAKGCTGQPAADCFNVPARFKRIYKIDFAQADAEGFVKKVGHIDLMDIGDPKGVARIGGDKGKFTFPFVTIEDVDVVDAEHVVVANDNNLPYSSGRALGKQDHNELILLRVPQFLSAK
ncbi:esterase-like activity of phytase family protein [Roseomonas genomospecies 6]|uniref:Glycerophosphodiester phosphodiesterase n=1 Tax=Roseomonas genomospecies 6 TaxID=214106 RepID=A0A9W7NM93_9PROT|nr:esterase-like activity of phytase family protein [Roseomonas genomospecies 6]KAA0682852.1 glycerophosphodiester phosphodiesterase [Roseomonas genomospecies 6]